MSQAFPCGPDLSDSTLAFKPHVEQIIVPSMGRLFTIADAVLKSPLPYLFPWTTYLRINDKTFCVLVIPQSNGRIVTRSSTSRFNATGQGATEEEALKDITEAIELLIEEEKNPSGETTWPEDFR